MVGEVCAHLLSHLLVCDSVSPRAPGLFPISNWPWHFCDSGCRPSSCGGGGSSGGSRGRGAGLSIPLPLEPGTQLELLYSWEVLAGEAARLTAQAPELFHYSIKVHYAGEETSNKT